MVTVEITMTLMATTEMVGTENINGIKTGLMLMEPTMMIPVKMEYISSVFTMITWAKI